MRSCALRLLHNVIQRHGQKPRQTNWILSTLIENVAALAATGRQLQGEAGPSAQDPSSVVVWRGFPADCVSVLI